MSRSVNGNMNESMSEWITKTTLHTDEGELWNLDYHLLTIDGGESTVYGLRVVKSTPEGVPAESEETLGITDSYEEVMSMITDFANGSVPPVVLFEMVDEWQSERYGVSLLTT